MNTVFYAKMTLTLLLLLFTFSEINSCVFKKKDTQPQNKINPGSWNDVHNDRLTIDGCVCGEHDHDELEDPKWNVFIGHSRNTLGIQEIHPICVGTIITSNLIATVLRCVLTSGDFTPNVYQAWMPETYSKGIINKSDIIVSTLANGEGEIFTVEEIIFGTLTLQQSLTRQKKVHNDLILLKINVSGDEFIGKSHLRPICIPWTNSLDFSSRLGTYYGIGVGQHPGNFSSDFHHGIINSKRLCDSDLGKDADDDNSTEQVESLCLRWRKSKEMPSLTFKGGSLLIESVNDGTSFLAGVEYEIEFSKHCRADENNYMFAYFTNILPMIKYIENRANQHQSKWCRTPSLVLPDKVSPPSEKIDKCVGSNKPEVPFDGNEIPEVPGSGSWWCVEHHDIINNMTKTDWGRFAEGANVLKEEVYKCDKFGAKKNSILFFQKGNPEPFATAKVPETKDGKKGYECFDFKDI